MKKKIKTKKAALRVVSQNLKFEKIMIPKVLSVVMVVLLYLFVGEIFSENFQWSNPFLAVIPGSVYLILTSVAWKRQRFGGGLFAILGIGSVMFNIWQGRDALAIYILALITFVLGFLFISFSGKKP